MELRTDLPLKCLETPANTDQRGVVVLLHGLGATVDDLVSLVDELRFPARFVLLEAPHAVAMGEHYQGYAWYQRQGEQLVGLDESIRLIRESLNRLDVDAARTVVGGFSQGAATALSVVLAAEQTPAGLAMLSGYVARPQVLDARRERIQDLYLLLCHGIHDDVVPFGDGLRALDLLAARGARGRLVAFPTSHWIPGEAVVELRRFLDERLKG
ncbi:MAG: carboxylesterase [Myxococcota bacterium]